MSSSRKPRSRASSESLCSSSKYQARLQHVADEARCDEERVAQLDA